MTAALCTSLVAIWVWVWVVPVRLPLRRNIQLQIDRLEGQKVAPARGAGYEIEDIASAGRPLVGRIARRGDALWLATTAGNWFRLAGPLAIPRIAGPKYEVWVIGRVRGRVLEIERLGVLAPPRTAPDTSRGGAHRVR